MVDEGQEDEEQEQAVAEDGAEEMD